MTALPPQCECLCVPSVVDTGRNLLTQHSTTASRNFLQAVDVHSASYSNAHLITLKKIVFNWLLSVYMCDRQRGWGCEPTHATHNVCVEVRGQRSEDSFQESVLASTEGSELWELNSGPQADTGGVFTWWAIWLLSPTQYFKNPMDIIVRKCPDPVCLCADSSCQS